MVEPTEQTIYNWWNRHLVDTGRRAGTPSIENSALIAARSRIAELEKELATTRRANGLLKKVVPPRSKFEAISAMAGEGHAVERACRITGVSHAGYDMWRLRDRPGRIQRFRT